MGAHPGLSIASPFRNFVSLCSFLLLLCPASAASANEDALEARLDAFEAEAARQSLNKLSLTLWGQVNRAALIWDDGVESDAFITDNIYSSSRVIMSGRAALNKSLSAGFHIEVEYRDAGSSTVSQLNDEGSDEANETGASIRTRQNFWHMKHESLGKVSAGQLSPITNSLVYFNLWHVTVNTSPDALINTAFFLRNGRGELTDLKWGNIAAALDTPRGDYVRYDSPSIGGFTLSGDWGENDAWDAALTFDKTGKDWRVSAGLGLYREDELIGATDVRASLLVIHNPTGIYAHFGANHRDLDAQGRDDASLYYVHLGVAAKLISEGPTTFFGEYGRYDGLYAGRAAASVKGLPEAGGDGAADDFVGRSAVNRWGLGVMQSFAQAGFEVYGHFNRYEADLRVDDATGPDIGRVEAELEPWTALVVGSRFKF